MYRNLGHKIKLIAKVCRWVLFALLELAGAAGLIMSRGTRSMAIGGAAVMALGPLVAWLCTLLVYTLGHLVENSDIRTDLAVRQYKMMSAAPAPAAATTTTATATIARTLAFITFERTSLNNNLINTS